MRKYISMSHERRLQIPAVSVSNFLQSGGMTTFEFTEETRHGLEAFKAAFQYVNGPEDGAASPKAAENYRSAFDAGMPGLLTLNEIAAKEDVLGQWKLKLGDITASLEVNFVATSNKIPL